MGKETEADMSRKTPKRGGLARPAAIALLAFALSLGSGSCRTGTSGQYAMLALSGPLNFVPGFGLYTISGTVKNNGSGTARSVKVTMTIYPGALTSWTVTNPADLPPGASGSFAVAFSDPDMSIRNSIIKDATQVTFEFDD